jgi:hypothetical protein
MVSRKLTELCLALLCLSASTDSFASWRGSNAHGVHLWWLSEGKAEPTKLDQHKPRHSKLLKLKRLKLLTSF